MEPVHAATGPSLVDPSLAVTPLLAAPGDVQTLTDLLRHFRRRLDDPLLPLPDPKVVRRRLFSVKQPSARRSRRLAAKGAGTSAIKRAQRILMEKLGVCHEGERLSAAQLEDYAAIFASPLGPEQVGAIAALFGLDCHGAAVDSSADGAAV
jgi:hypothetical protein